MLTGEGSTSLDDRKEFTVATRRKNVVEPTEQAPPSTPTPTHLQEQAQGPRFAARHAANPPPNSARYRQRVPVDPERGTPLADVIAAGWPRADGSVNVVFYDIPGTAANEAEVTRQAVTPKPTRPAR
jgi:hypothetical protein